MENVLEGCLAFLSIVMKTGMLHFLFVSPVRFLSSLMPVGGGGVVANRAWGVVIEPGADPDGGTRAPTPSATVGRLGLEALVRWHWSMD